MKANEYKNEIFTLVFKFKVQAQKYTPKTSVEIHQKWQKKGKRIYKKCSHEQPKSWEKWSLKLLINSNSSKITDWKKTL